MVSERRGSSPLRSLKSTWRSSPLGYQYECACGGAGRSPGWNARPSPPGALSTWRRASAAIGALPARSRISPASTNPASEYSAPSVRGPGFPAAATNCRRVGVTRGWSNTRKKNASGGITHPCGVAEQVAHGRLRVATPGRVPAADRIVQAKVALLDEPHRGRGGDDLGDAVERDRGVGGHRPARVQHGVAGRARPLAPVREHDRGGRTWDAGIGDLLRQRRVEAVGRRRRELHARRSRRPVLVRSSASGEEDEHDAGESQARHVPTLHHFDRSNHPSVEALALPRDRAHREQQQRPAQGHIGLLAAPKPTMFTTHATSDRSPPRPARGGRGSGRSSEHDADEH